MILMQYANNDKISYYLYQNINKLTWKMKLQYLHGIANHLWSIHHARLIHCDLHGGNIVLNTAAADDDESTKPFICDLGLSKSVNSSQSTSTIQGVLPY